MKTQFIYIIENETNLQIFSKQIGPGAPQDGDMVNLGGLSFTDSEGDRMDLLNEFLKQCPALVQR